MDSARLRLLRSDVARASAALAVDGRDSYRRNPGFVMKTAIASGLTVGERIALSALPRDEAEALLRA